MLKKPKHKTLLAIFALLGLFALGGCGGEEEPEQGAPEPEEDSYDSTGGGSA